MKMLDMAFDSLPTLWEELDEIIEKSLKRAIWSEVADRCTTLAPPFWWTTTATLHCTDDCH